MTSSGRGFSKRRETLSSTSEPSSTGDTPAHTSLLRFDTFIFTHTHRQYAHTSTPSLRLVLCSCGAEVRCGTRCSAGVDSRRPTLRGAGAMWSIYEAADPVQDTGGASTLRRPPASASQTCDSIVWLPWQPHQAMATAVLPGRQTAVLMN